MRRKIRKRWSQREKKILLNAIKNCGHSNIDNMAEVLPLKNKHQISSYLNEMKKIASFKLKKKYYKTQHELQRINQWISLLNLPNEAHSVLHKNLSAFLLLVMEKYCVYLYSPATMNFEAMNFTLAYRFVFESLYNTSPCSIRINDEITALLFSSFNQLLEEIRSENNAVDKIFNSSVSRLLNQKKKSQSTVIIDDGSIFALFEINPFRWTKEEIGILCRKKY